METSNLDEPTLRRLIQVGRSLVSRLDVEGILEQVLDAARELTGAEYAALGILDESKEELERFLTLGIDEETHNEIGDLPRGRGVLGELIRHPEPLRLDDVSSHPRSYGFPTGHPPMHSFLGVPITIRGEAWGNLYLTEKRDGASFDEQDESAALVLADWAAIGIENARLYEGLALRRDEIEQQRDQAERSVRGLEAMTDIARSVGGETRLERILELIVKRGRALVEARALLIFLVDGDSLKVAATGGELPDRLEGARLPIETTLAGQVLHLRQAERLTGPEALIAELGELGIEAEAAMMVPLSFRGSASGVLVALDRLVDGPDFGGEDERLLRSFAASAATAVATAKTVEAERLRQSLEAAEMERKRWARELHDETLQALGALRMLNSAALQSGASAEHLRSALEEGVELISDEIDNLSSLIVELRPAALDQIGLAPALRTLAERRSADSGISIDVLVRLDQGSESDRLPTELESTIYRFVQEALSNIAKHADATRAEAVVERHEGVVSISVSDNGRGFDPDQVGGGFGLVGMRERVELAGGDLEISSEPGNGTVVSATLPLEPGAAQRSSSSLSST